MKHNPDNERTKRRYFVFLKDAKGQNPSSIDGVAMALTKFEKYNKRKSFKAFHYEQAIGFKNFLLKQISESTGEMLSKATIHSTLRHLKAFFQWLCLQNGYKSKLNYSDMEYFNMAENDVRVATARREKRVPSIEQITRVIHHMPSETAIEKRNRALVAFTLLTGARDSAIVTFKLQHVDIKGRSVYQDARQVKTKFAKTFRTYFFPIDDKFYQIVAEWMNYLKTELLFGDNDPLFPKTKMGQDHKQEFAVNGLVRENWSNANPIRAIFKTAFTQAGLDYYNPHSFRDTLVRLGEVLCRTPEEFKAWSQNLGHEQVLTTFSSYGEVPQNRQSEVLERLRNPFELTDQTDIQALARAVLARRG